MATIVVIHSFRRGTGKTTTTANLAALLAAQGRRVGVIDTDIQSPSLHILFGLPAAALPLSLNDYLWGRCDIEQTACDVTARLPGETKGRAFLIPASANAAEIAGLLREGYALSLRNDAFGHLVRALSLDLLLIDTHAGLSEETLLAIAIADRLAVVLRLDQQDYQGTGVTLDLARRLGVPRTLLAVNMVPAAFAPATVARQVAETYGCDVAGVLPYTDDLISLGSAGLFAKRHPAHPLTAAIGTLSAALEIEG